MVMKKILSIFIIIVALSLCILSLWFVKINLDMRKSISSVQDTQDARISSSLEIYKKRVKQELSDVYKDNTDSYLNIYEKLQKTTKDPS